MRWLGLQPVQQTLSQMLQYKVGTAIKANL